MIDKSLHRGQQNFFFVATDTSDETYDYVAYINKEGSILLAEFPKDGSSARYCIKSGDFSTIWAAKDTYDYVLPNELVDPEI